MIKKLMWLLSIVGVLSFSSCGGGSSNEAKELLSKILQFVGIPQTIVANICQDENRDGICGGGELFTKVIISKGDKIDDIWKKILLTDDGKYFLETYNSELPILVELQDVARVNYDDGKFTLVFDGFITKEDDNEKKEISILESMVDADALTKVEADKFRTLTNPEAQDKYYTALLESLETNINTLRNNEFDRVTAMSATIIEMADETRVNQAQADRINACGNNQTCVDKEIKKLFDELIITENEVLEIKAKQETNNNTTSNNSSNQTIDKSWITPTDSICNDNGGIVYSEYNLPCTANWDNGKNICRKSGGELPSIDVLRQVIIDCGGILNDDDKNEKNQSYQTCYKEQGFTSASYWSSTKRTSDSIWGIRFQLGDEVWGGKDATSAIRCIKSK